MPTLEERLQRALLQAQKKSSERQRRKASGGLGNGEAQKVMETTPDLAKENLHLQLYGLWERHGKESTSTSTGSRDESSKEGSSSRQNKSFEESLPGSSLSGCISSNIWGQQEELEVSTEMTPAALAMSQHFDLFHPIFQTKDGAPPPHQLAAAAAANLASFEQDDFVNGLLGLTNALQEMEELIPDEPFSAFQSAGEGDLWDGPVFSREQHDEDVEPMVAAAGVNSAEGAANLDGEDGVDVFGQSHADLVGAAAEASGGRPAEERGTIAGMGHSGRQDASLGRGVAGEGDDGTYSNMGAEGKKKQRTDAEGSFEAPDHPSHRADNKGPVSGHAGGDVAATCPLAESNGRTSGAGASTSRPVEVDGGGGERRQGESGRCGRKAQMEGGAKQAALEEREEAGGASGAGAGAAGGGGGGSSGGANPIALLVDLAQAIVSGDSRRLSSAAAELEGVASAYGSSTQRLSFYFMQGLLARIDKSSKFAGQKRPALPEVKAEEFEAERSDCDSHIMVAVQALMNSTPYVSFGQVTANCAILEAIGSAPHVHIVDFGIGHGLHWYPLLRALGSRAGGRGRQSVKITGVDVLAPWLRRAYCLIETRQRLESVAQKWGVPFKMDILPSKIEDVKIEHINVCPDEVVAVHCALRLSQVLDDSVTPSDPRGNVLRTIRALKPAICTIVEQHTNHNSPFFLARFYEALYYYAGLFDSLDASIAAESKERRVIEQQVLGKAILNVVACEGQQRTHRPEAPELWQRRMQKAGMVPSALSENVTFVAHELLKTYKEGFSISSEGKNNLTLRWQDSPLLIMSSWKPDNL